MSLAALAERVRMEQTKSFGRLSKIIHRCQRYSMCYSANVLPDEPRRVLTTRHDVPAFRILGRRDIHCGDHSGHEDEKTGVCEVHAWTDSATMLHVRTRDCASSDENKEREYETHRRPNPKMILLGSAGSSGDIFMNRSGLKRSGSGYSSSS